MDKLGRNSGMKKGLVQFVENLRKKSYIKSGNYKLPYKINLLKLLLNNLLINTVEGNFYQIHK